MVYYRFTRFTTIGTLAYSTDYVFHSGYDYEEDFIREYEKFQRNAPADWAGEDNENWEQDGDFDYMEITKEEFGNME